MKPDIRTIKTNTDLEQPGLPKSTGSVGTYDLSDGSVTAAKLDHHAYYATGPIDGGVVGITGAMDSWTSKGLDGGAL